MSDKLSVKVMVAILEVVAILQSMAILQSTEIPQNTGVFLENGVFLIKTEKEVGDRALAEINFLTLVKSCASSYSLNICSFLKAGGM